MKSQQIFTAFAGSEQVAQGNLLQVAQRVKQFLAAHRDQAVLVFSNQTGEQVDIDLHGNSQDLARRYQTPTVNTSETTPKPKPRRPGRPKLGVVGREITLLPRHWEWLSVQPGGASVTLRKLVEKARLGSKQRDMVRFSREAAFRYISAIAGNEPGFEEANRALFSGNRKGFVEQIRNWPPDVRDFVMMLAADAFGPEEA